jgi:hypothetical protein
MPKKQQITGPENLLMASSPVGKSNHGKTAISDCLHYPVAEKARSPASLAAARELRAATLLPRRRAV